MPKNCLALHVTYCPNWNLGYAIREIIQNSIDGAVEWLKQNQEHTGLVGKGKSDIKPAGQGWFIEKQDFDMVAKQS